MWSSAKWEFPIETSPKPTYIVKDFTKPMHSPTKHIAESTVRRLSLYLRFLEEFESRGQATISSGELARSGGTTSAQVRKDLSFFGSFGKRGLGYDVTDLVASIREILGLQQPWPVIIIGAGKIGAALATYSGFTTRGFHVVGVYDNDPKKVGTSLDGVIVRPDGDLEADIAKHAPRIAVLAVPSENAQSVVDRVVAAGINAVLSFSPAPLQAPAGVTVRAVNMATELEILAYSLTHGV
jgi:redox-sensing transcriptional repressor